MFFPTPARSLTRRARRGSRRARPRSAGATHLRASHDARRARISVSKQRADPQALHPVETSRGNLRRASVFSGAIASRAGARRDAQVALSSSCRASHNFYFRARNFERRIALLSIRFLPRATNAHRHARAAERLFVAPMAGVTDRPFRKLCKRFGAGLAVSEMVASDPGLRATEKSRRRAGPSRRGRADRGADRRRRSGHDGGCGARERRVAAPRSSTSTWAARQRRSATRPPGRRCCATRSWWRASSTRL